MVRIEKYNVVHLLSPVSFWREFKIETQKLGLEYKTKSSGDTVVKGIKFKSDDSDSSDVKIIK